MGGGSALTISSINVSVAPTIINTVKPGRADYTYNIEKLEII